MINIAEEPRGEVYRFLLRLARRSCKRFSLVWQDKLRFDSSANELTERLEPYLVSEERTDTWPGTRIFRKNATIRHYLLNRESAGVLQEAEGLYAWLSPRRPEDLALYTDSGDVWLATVSHEKIAWFGDAAPSREKLIDFVPGLDLFPP
jgi:hypothetical protein